mmetsp:Transcript_6916/g.10117  ORF Transcript_6916/g.10117 Transcript_6916/m.10117 type:complete len:572 (+) Transcript_6916:23-1738(+)
MKRNLSSIMSKTFQFQPIRPKNIKPSYVFNPKTLMNQNTKYWLEPENEIRRCYGRKKKKNKKRSLIKYKPTEEQQLEENSTTMSLLKKLTDPSLRIAIVGRPNVGKSSIFNKLLEKKVAITSNYAHCTRDVIEQKCQWKDKYAKTTHTVTLIDTPGTPDTGVEDIKSATREALESADLAIFVSSFQEGMTEMDIALARFVHSFQNIGILHVINKCDNMHEWHEKGDEFDSIKGQTVYQFGKPILISANDNNGWNALLNAINPLCMRGHILRESYDRKCNLAIIGRANVGKSTLINEFLGEERLLVSNIPGTSRDRVEIDCLFNYMNYDYAIKIIDTAGLRLKKHLRSKVLKREKHDEYVPPRHDPTGIHLFQDQPLQIEWESEKETLRALRYSNVVCMLIDASAGVKKEDLLIANKIVEQGRALIVVANKWDLVEHEEEVLSSLRESFIDNLNGVDIVVASAKHGVNMNMILEKVVENYEKWNKRIPTPVINRFVRHFLDTMVHIPRKYPRIKFITQVSRRPPTFVIFYSQSAQEGFPKNFERMLKNAIRKEFGLQGVPIRFKFRRKSRYI